MSLFLDIQLDTKQLKKIFDTEINKLKKEIKSLKKESNKLKLENEAIKHQLYEIELRPPNIGGKIYEKAKLQFENKNV